MAAIKKTKLKTPYQDNGQATFKIRKRPGCYIIYKNDKVRYVGFSGVDVYKALYRHFQSWNDKRQQRVTYERLAGIKVRVIYTNTAGQASKLEKALIIKLKPTDNLQQYWLNYDIDASEQKIYDNYINEPTSDIIINEHNGDDLPILKMEKKTKIYLSIGATLAAIAFFARKPIGKMARKLLTDQDKKNFILSILPAAKSIGKSIGVPPMFIVAQICLESRYGASQLAAKYFNYGGIKAVGSQASVELPTTECKNGVCFKTKAKFAVYPNQYEGLAAQSKIYQNKYFKKYLNQTTDALKYAQLLQSGQVKYATALNYVSTIGATLKEINRLLT